MLGWIVVGPEGSQGARPLLQDAMVDTCHGIAHAAGYASIGSLHCLLEGRPFWKGPESRPAQPAEIAAAAQEKLSRVLDEIDGHYALAIYDERERSLVLAVDRMGIGSLSWARQGSVVAFSNSPYDAAQLLSESPRIDPQKLYDYFFFHMVPSPGTVFLDVNKLAPGATIRLTASGEAHERYWRPHFRTARSNADPRLLADELKSRLTEAVRRRYQPGRTGAFLSGGLDSSTVSGLLADVAEGPAQTFSIGFGVPDFDEIEYARVAARHFALDSHEYVVTPDDVVEAIDIVAAS